MDVSCGPATRGARPSLSRRQDRKNQGLCPAGFPTTYSSTLAPHPCPAEWLACHCPLLATQAHCTLAWRGRGRRPPQIGTVSAPVSITELVAMATGGWGRGCCTDLLVSGEVVLCWSQIPHAQPLPGSPCDHPAWGSGMGKGYGEEPGSAWDVVGGTIPSSSLASALKALQRHAPPDGPGGRLRVVTWIPLAVLGGSAKSRSQRSLTWSGDPQLYHGLCAQAHPSGRVKAAVA